MLEFFKKTFPRYVLFQNSMEISQDWNFPQFLINICSKILNFNKNSLSTLLLSFPFQKFLLNFSVQEHGFFLFASQLYFKGCRKTEAIVLCVGQQICITGTLPTWGKDFASLDLSTLDTHGVFALESVCMSKCERKTPIECQRLGQATVVPVLQREVRKLHP